VRWQQENPDAVADFTWRWFHGEPALGLDRREYIQVDFGFIPPFEVEVLEETSEYEVVRNRKGAAAWGCCRACMRIVRTT